MVFTAPDLQRPILIVLTLTLLGYVDGSGKKVAILSRSGRFPTLPRLPFPCSHWNVSGYLLAYLIQCILFSAGLLRMRTFPDTYSNKLLTAGKLRPCQGPVWSSNPPIHVQVYSKPAMPDWLKTVRARCNGDISGVCSRFRIGVR